VESLVPRYQRMVEESPPHPVVATDNTVAEEEPAVAAAESKLVCSKELSGD